MHNIIIEFQGFGAIQQILEQPSSVIVPVNSSVHDILEQLLLKQPQVSAEVERCACAVGDEMLLRSAIIEHSCTLVLLSPVAGG